MTQAWTVARWNLLDAQVLGDVADAASDRQALDVLRRAAKDVLRAFSGSFFLVTRFLPAPKRGPVEMIYAAVRYPDEIVDTFPLDTAAKLENLRRWDRWHTEALAIDGVRNRLQAGVPWILAGFAEVERKSGIPSEHYCSFLDAMRRDALTRPFGTLEQLIAEYVYGSAIVVGYFLAHVYGAADGATLADTYRCAGNLGVALQLTNFARDVVEDAERGRSYIPTEFEGSRGAVLLAEEAERRYQCAERELSVFAPDTRPAIRACIDVYRLLNRRILRADQEARVRHSVPIAQKFAALPASKYWRVPLAYLGGL